MAPRGLTLPGRCAYDRGMPFAYGSHTYGWCDNPAHGGADHTLLPTCARFVSDAENTRQLLAEAREHDARVTYSAEAAYVDEHRPY